MRRLKSVVRLLAAAWVMVLITLTPQLASAYSAVGDDDSVLFSIAVKVGPEARYETRQSFERKDWARAWSSAAPEQTAASLVYTDTYMEIDEGGARRQFAMREDGVLIEMGAANRSITLPAKVRNQWVGHAKELRSRHYGELLDWKEAKERIPRKAKLTVLDMETGLTFQGQRRAGSRHADVQPLTRADTAVMKQIYGGTWSWKRRAIVVMADGRQIAASMHGMPHGGDGIPDNDFSGHFCIHFLGSSTHRSGQLDLAHQLMTHKAAGKLANLIGQYSPDRLALATFEAIHQHDEALLRALLDGSPALLYEQFEKLLRSVEDIRSNVPQPPADYADTASVTAEVPVKLTLRGKGGGIREEAFRLLYVRETVHSSWVLTDVQTNKKR